MREGLDRCLACRARLADDSVCPRCGCDFSLARQALVQAAGLFAQTMRALAVGDRVAARRQLDASLSLHRQRLGEAIGQWLDLGATEDGSREAVGRPALEGPLAAQPGDIGLDWPGQGDAMVPLTASAGESGFSSRQP